MVTVLLAVTEQFSGEVVVTETVCGPALKLAGFKELAAAPSIVNALPEMLFNGNTGSLLQYLFASVPKLAVGAALISTLCEEVPVQLFALVLLTGTVCVPALKLA